MNNEVNLESAEQAQNPNSAESAAAPMEPQRAKEAIEAILFAAGHPVTLQKLSDTLNLPMRVLRTLLQEMEAWYDRRGIQLLMLGDSCQLATREQYLEYIKTALGIRRGGNLSKNSFEVLAIVAYNQPVTRSFVDEVRGVDSGYIMSSLAEKGLIEAKGKLDLPGRPTLWGTSADFLRVFGLTSLKQLPAAELFLRPEENLFAEQIALELEQSGDGAEPRAAAAEAEPAEEESIL